MELAPCIKRMPPPSRVLARWGLGIFISLGLIVVVGWLARENREFGRSNPGPVALS